MTHHTHNAPHEHIAVRIAGAGTFDIHLPDGEIIESQTKERAEAWLDWIAEQEASRQIGRGGVRSSASGEEEFGSIPSPLPTGGQ